MKDLRGFAAYIRKNRFEAFVMENIRTMNALDTPLDKLFPDLTEKQVIEKSMLSSKKFLLSIEENTALARAMESLKKWETNELPEISS
jgi:hypothetical protein